MSGPTGMGAGAQLTLERVWFFDQSPSRFFQLLKDQDSWLTGEAARRVATKEDERLVFNFSDLSRAELLMTRVSAGETRLLVRHAGLRDARALRAREAFWGAALGSLAKRIGARFATVATAPAKLNLYLAVGSLRPDGYHSVATLYEALSLRELVRAWPSDSWSLAMESQLPEAEQRLVPLDDKNLVLKAARAIAKKVRSKQALALTIHKSVPVAAGLAGGSADAAAALLVAAGALGAKLSAEQLLEFGAGLGADVPFSLQGGTAVGLGTGREVSAVKALARLHWVLIPGVEPLRTPEVYLRLDERRQLRGEQAPEEPKVPRALLSAVRRGELESIADLMHNDLEEAALSLQPELAKTLTAGVRSGALRSMVSGSGPTVALLCESEVHAGVVARNMERRGYRALVTSSPEPGARLEG